MYFVCASSLLKVYFFFLLVVEIGYIKNDVLVGWMLLKRDSVFVWFVWWAGKISKNVEAHYRRGRTSDISSLHSRQWRQRRHALIVLSWEPGTQCLSNSLNISGRFSFFLLFLLRPWRACTAEVATPTQRTPSFKVVEGEKGADWEVENRSQAGGWFDGRNPRWKSAVRLFSILIQSYSRLALSPSDPWRWFSFLIEY